MRSTNDGGGAECVRVAESTIHSIRRQEARADPASSVRAPKTIAVLAAGMSGECLVIQEEAKMVAGLGNMEAMLGLGQ